MFYVFLLQFVLDLHSGKLHKHFHETLDERIAQLQKAALEQLGLEGPDASNSLPALDGEVRPPAVVPPILDTTPPPSVFKELKPSDKRYSLKKDRIELWAFAVEVYFFRYLLSDLKKKNAFF